MTNIRVCDKNVDVSHPACRDQECFVLFADKGTFAPGRGYTSYHDKPRWVCGTRHLHGCPDAGVCRQCRTLCSPPTLAVGRCGWCGSTDLEARDEDVAVGECGPAPDRGSR